MEPAPEPALEPAAAVESGDGRLRLALPREAWLRSPTLALLLEAAPRFREGAEGRVVLAGVSAEALRAAAAALSGDAAAMEAALPRDAEELAAVLCGADFLQIPRLARAAARRLARQLAAAPAAAPRLLRALPDALAAQLALYLSAEQLLALEEAAEAEGRAPLAAALAGVWVARARARCRREARSRVSQSPAAARDCEVARWAAAALARLRRAPDPGSPLARALASSHALALRSVRLSPAAARALGIARSLRSLDLRGCALAAPGVGDALLSALRQLPPVGALGLASAGLGARGLQCVGALLAAGGGGGGGGGASPRSPPARLRAALRASAATQWAASLGAKRGVEEEEEAAAEDAKEEEEEEEEEEGRASSGLALDLGGCALGDAFAEALCAALAARGARLRRLDVARNAAAGDAGAALLAGAVARAPLQHLRAGGCGALRPGLRALLAAAARAPALRALDVGDGVEAAAEEEEAAGDEAAAAAAAAARAQLCASPRASLAAPLASLASRAPRLRVLDLSGAPLAPREVVALAGALAGGALRTLRLARVGAVAEATATAALVAALSDTRCPLEALSLAGCALPARATAALAAALASNGTLRAIDLSGADADTAAAAALAAALRGNSTLRVLALRGAAGARARLREEGGRAIAAALRGSALRQLSLCRQALREAGAVAVAEAAAAGGALRALSLGANHVDAEGRARVEEAAAAAAAATGARGRLAIDWGADAARCKGT